VALEHIRDYVTQHDDNGNIRSNYLAVKTANIYTKFPNHDVTGLCLVDLPGLEAAQGHEKKLVASLEQEVDAVILVKKPSPQGDQWNSDDFLYPIRGQVWADKFGALAKEMALRSQWQAAINDVLKTGLVLHQDTRGQVLYVRKPVRVL
jgi:hypothetical protein